MQNIQKKQVSIEVSRHEQQLIEFMRLHGIDIVAASLYDLYCIALFDFPEGTEFEPYKNAFFHVEGMINVLAPRTSLIDKTVSAG